MKRDDLLDLNEALQHPGKTIAVDLSTELPSEGEIDLVKPLEGYLEAVSTGNVLLITGEFTTCAMCECARCGAAIEQPIDFVMEEEFTVDGIPSIYASDDYARVRNDEEEPLFHENSLIVESLLRQGLLLNLPVQPLCSAGWDGPCDIAESQHLPSVKPAGGTMHMQLEGVMPFEEAD